VLGEHVAWRAEMPFAELRPRGRSSSRSGSRSIRAATRARGCTALDDVPRARARAARAAPRRCRDARGDGCASSSRASTACSRLRPLQAARLGLGVELKGTKEGHWSAPRPRRGRSGTSAAARRSSWVDPTAAVSCAALTTGVRRLGKSGLGIPCPTRVIRVGGVRWSRGESSRLTPPFVTAVRVRLKPHLNSVPRRMRRTPGARRKVHAGRRLAITQGRSSALTVAVRIPSAISGATSPERHSPGRSRRGRRAPLRRHEAARPEWSHEKRSVCPPSGHDRLARGGPPPVSIRSASFSNVAPGSEAEEPDPLQLGDGGRYVTGSQPPVP
jgi:hypothetical protein